MSKRSGKAPTQRQLRVGEVLKHAISETFMRGDVYGPDKKTISVTVSEVRVSPDLRNATVFVMPLGGIEKEEVIEKINIIAPQIRGIISSKVNLRFSPSLFFKLDNSFENATKLNQLLNKPEVARDLEPEEK